MAIIKLLLKFTALLPIALGLGGCFTWGDGSPPGGSTPEGSSQGIRVWARVPKSADFIDAAEIDRVVVSLDQKWAYVVGDAGKKLVAVEIGGKDGFAGNIGSKDKWHAIDFSTNDNGLDGTPGKNKADMRTNQSVRQAVATEHGVLISAKGPGGGGGVFYLVGKEMRANWSPWKPDLSDAVSDDLCGYAIRDNGAERPIVFSCGGLGNKSMICGNTQVTLDAPGELFCEGTVRRGLWPWDGSKLFAAINGAVGLFLVDELVGINLLPITLFGKSTITGAKAVQLLNNGRDHQTTGINKWLPNNKVSDLAYANGRLFIGFRSNESDGKGGVAIFTPESKIENGVVKELRGGLQLPDPLGGEWENVSVLHLTQDAEGAVFAVTSKGLIEVLVTPSFIKMGRKLNKAYYEAQGDKFEGTMPESGITDAAFVGDNLLVGTKSDGLFYNAVKTN